MIALAVIFGSIVVLAIAYAAGVSHGFDLYEATDLARREGEWIEPGAAYDYQEPYRGKVAP